MTRADLPPAPPSGGAARRRRSFPEGSVWSWRAPAWEIARRHRAEFPDEEERYGDRGLEWCAYDNQWILSWAAAEAAGFGDLAKRVEWLAGILEARGYPVERLARDLEIAAGVVPPLRAVLEAGAAAVRDTGA